VRGFTLVEVLVALFVMAIMAGMAWKGVDGLVRARDGARSASETTLRLTNAMTQWQNDLNQIHNSSAVPALTFDGVTLRLTRHTADGVQLVVWTLQGGNWLRWASPAVSRIAPLQQYWLRSQQVTAIEPDALKLIDQVSDVKVYFYINNAWVNPQSTRDVQVVQSQAPAGSAANGVSVTSIDVLPTGVRLVLTLPQGVLTRDVLVTPAGS
jgi:general secretion pathway protein J